MKYIENRKTDPRFNLALEEVLFQSADEKEECFFLLWQNEPTVVVGRFQNTLEEINVPVVREKGIHVVRRLSGGGAVYHDLGNLNFTFILRTENPQDLDFRKMTEPVISALWSLGVDGGLVGRNDLVIQGKKFSGNAQYMREGRFLHHGTILYDSNLDVLEEVLQTDPDKFKSKGVKSVRSRVTNIKPHLKGEPDIEEFRRALLFTVKERWPGLQISPPDPSVQEKAMALAESKYGTWDWNYGASPEFDLRKERRFDFGKVDVRLNVRKGNITSCRIFGDFFGNGDIASLEDGLAGTQFSEKGLSGTLARVDVSHYISGMDSLSFMELVLA
ncbi:MAG TPA: lipoate--protein ligase [Synergistales bacterium]|nr:lipoate--protein ligase [Synergistales bacterium]